VKLPRYARAAAAWLLAAGALGAAGSSKDPLAAEIARWQAYLETNRSTDEMWAEVRAASQPLLAGAGKALHDGRRLLALQRLATAYPNLAASAYLSGLPPADLQTPAAFETEWKRMGTVLAPDLAPLRADVLSGVGPSAVRALGEVALPQVRAYYETGLEYGQNTMAKYGLYYVGAARGQRDFAAFTRALSEPSPKAPPPLRPLATDLDAFENEMLAAYRPPASIDRHGEFIAASAALKQARELDAAGLRYGALDAYLRAALRLSAVPADPDVAAKLAAFDARITQSATDHSIGRLYLETAQADMAAVKPGAPPLVAAAIVSDVLPRYFAALEPARPEKPKPAPEVTVTLVRWPYT
jgi:hypothetical protein